MPGRSFSTLSYRYGLNGQEKDDEITGVSGAHTTAEFWEYDSRLGRRWNVDPWYKSYPYKSPYSSFGNNPIFFKDPQGLGEKDAAKKEINVMLVPINRKTKEGKVDVALESDYTSAKYTASTNSNFFVLEVANIKDAGEQLSKLRKEQNADIGTLYISSHGTAETNTFWIGSEAVGPNTIGNRENSQLSAISAQLVANKSNVVILACHVGANDYNSQGGKGRGDVFLQKVANRLQANVYGNRSWTPTFFGQFAIGMKLNARATEENLKSADDYLQRGGKKRAGIIDEWGYWSHATPQVGSTISTQMINTLHLNPNGTFGISKSWNDFNYWHREDIQDLLKKHEISPE